MKLYNTLLLSLAVLLPTWLLATIEVQNPSIIGNVSITRFDPCTGTFFVGSNATDSGLHYVSRSESNQRPYVSTIASSTEVSLNDVALLTLTPPSSCNPLALVCQSGDPENLPNASNAITLADRCNFQATTETLNDSNSNVATGIVSLASSECYVLATVTPAGVGIDLGRFGISGSGIARILIEKNPLDLCITNAQNGGPGNLAFPLDNTSEVFSMSGDSVMFSTTTESNRVVMTYDEILCRTFIGVQISPDNGNEDNVAKSVVVVQSDSTGSDPLIVRTILPNNNAISNDESLNEIIVVRQINLTRVPTLRNFALQLLHASTGPSYLIVAGGAEISPNELQNPTNAAGNTIYALPLVNNFSDDAEHATLANKNSPLANGKFVVPASGPGQLANTSDASAFVGAGPVPFNPMATITSEQIISDIQVVGDAVYVSVSVNTNNAETEPESDAGLFVSHAQFDQEGKIIGWTPWSLRAFPAFGFKTVENNTGSDDADICALPASNSEMCNTNQAVSFFAVDAHNAQVWALQAIESTETPNFDVKNISNIPFAFNSSPAYFVRTNWSIGKSRGTDLLSALQRTDLRCGTCSAYDFNSSVPGVACNTQANNRYMLFGGIETVVFTRISVAQELQTTLNPLGRPQIVIDRFDCPENILQTKLPTGAGPVCALGYTAVDNNRNYFLAGTPRGLYAFSNQGKGFEPSQLGTLNTGLFTRGGWTQVPSIPGPVIDIQSQGNILYVLFKQLSEQNVYESIVIRIPFATTISEMFDPNNIEIIARSGQFDLTGVQSINKIAILITDPAGDTEQLLLATSNGLFSSVTAVGTQQIGTSVNWFANSASDGIYSWIGLSPGTSAEVSHCTGLTGLGAASRQTTTWPAGSFIDICKTPRELAGIIRQYIRNNNSNFGTLNPNPFIAQTEVPRNSGCCACPTLVSLLDDLCCDTSQSMIGIPSNPPISVDSLPLLKVWWSDGGRRLGVTQDSLRVPVPLAQLFALPFNLFNWGFKSINDGFIHHPILDNLLAIYWISYAGWNGSLMLGTNKGVVGLA